MIAFRELISTALKIMEAGKFQDFCLKFLPLYDPAFGGLIRFGHTVTGKTRKGTPDLLKTTDDGHQIAVQCSTEEDYWTPPKEKEKYSKSWKPCYDIDRCIEHLQNLSEIVLCCIKEIPTNQPNAKTEIIEYAKSRTKSTISILSLADIDEFLAGKVGNIEFEGILREFFPEVFQFIQTAKDAQKNELALEILRERPLINIDSLIELLNHVLGQTRDIEEAKNLTLSKLDEIEPRYQSREISPFDGVPRKIVDQSPLDSVFGKVILLTGAPKSGKTSLLRQAVSNWVKNDCSIRWYNAEIATQAEEGEFVSEVVKTLLSEVLPRSLAHEIAYRRKSSDEIDSDQFRNDLDSKTIFILDNANRLSPASLRRFSDIVARIKKNSFANLAVLLTSNRDLHLACPTIDIVLTVPGWTQQELARLLAYSTINYDEEHADKYLELLEIKSGGHPALAVALARKYPLIPELFRSIIDIRSLEDEDLTQEVKSVLYQDLLLNADYQNFVQRLSVLVYPANSRVVDAICEKVVPAIATSPKVMIEYLGRAIVEGDEKSGFYVAHVFKEVAKQQITQGQQLEVFRKVSAILLEPRGKVLDVKDVTEGINYALVGLEIERALFWSMFLLHHLLRKPPEPEQLRYVLDRVELVTLLNPPEEPNAFLLYGTVIVCVALGYSHLKDHQKALRVLARFQADKSPVVDGELATASDLTRESISLFKFTELCLAREYRQAADELTTFDFEHLERVWPTEAKRSLDLRALATEIITLIPAKEVPHLLIAKLVASTGLDDEAKVASLMNSAARIGLNALREGTPSESVIELFNQKGALAQLLGAVALAAYYLEKNDWPLTVRSLTEIENVLSKENIQGPLVKGHFLQQKADAEYLHGDLDTARTYYQAHLDLISDGSTFDYAWAQYRIGLTEENLELAEARFENASRVFARLGHFDVLSRCEGERGIALFQLGRREQFVRIVEQIVLEYFEKGNREFGTSCVIALAQANRLLLELESKPLTDMMGEPGLDGLSVSELHRRLSFSELKRRSYQQGASGATPTGGIIVAAYLLAVLYDKLGLKAEKLSILRRAFAHPVENRFDKESLPLVAKLYLEDLYDEHNYTEILRIITLILDCQMADIEAATKANFLSFCIFQRFDELTQGPSSDERANDYAQILTEMEKYCVEKQFSNLAFWLAAIYYRKSVLSGFRKAGREEMIDLWKRTYDYGVKGNNAQAIIYSSHALAFEFTDVSTSLRELAEIGFTFLKAVETQDGMLDQLRVLGENLFSLWSDIDFRRLSEYDLKAKKYLLDGAKSLKKAGFVRQAAGPLMLLLLARIYNHDGPTVDWALERLRDLDQTIPDDVVERLHEYLKRNDIK